MYFINLWRSYNLHISILTALLDVLVPITGSLMSGENCWERSFKIHSQVLYNYFTYSSLTLSLEVKQIEKTDTAYIYYLSLSDIPNRIVIVMIFYRKGTSAKHFRKFAGISGLLLVVIIISH